jgi:hypothetical protein
VLEAPIKAAAAAKVTMDRKDMVSYPLIRENQHGSAASTTP